MPSVATGVLFAVGHVMRYTPYTDAPHVRSSLPAASATWSASQHLEPVGYWHFAHSYVRGNWRNEAQSSFLLLAKSCHDLDWIRFVVGPARAGSCRASASLLTFHVAERPDGRRRPLRRLRGRADVRLLGGPLLPQGAGRPDLRYWVEIMTSDVSVAGVERALREGPVRPLRVCLGQ